MSNHPIAEAIGTGINYLCHLAAGLGIGYGIIALVHWAWRNT